MPTTPQGRALGRVGGSVPRSHARAIPGQRHRARATGGSRLEKLVAELGEKISRDSLERECIGGSSASASCERRASAVGGGADGEASPTRPRHRRTRASQARTECRRSHRSNALRPRCRQRDPRTGSRGNARPEPSSEVARAPHLRATRTRTQPLRGCAQVLVTTPSGMSRKASAASRPSRMR